MALPAGTACLGLGGDDILNSAWGADLLDGGPGFDFASYSEASTGVRASLADSSANGGEAVEFETFKPFQPRFDSYVDMEGLIGSRFDDVLVGDTRDHPPRTGYPAMTFCMVWMASTPSQGTQKRTF